jgi:hypothetical protein
VPWEACTGNYLPALNSITPNNDQSTTVGGDSRPTVSQYVERLDSDLAMPVEEVVWPTLASAWEASGATMPQAPSIEEVTTTQHQDRGIEAYNLENQSQDPLPASQQIVNTTAVPTEHTMGEENSSDTSSDSDYEMDIDDDDFDQTTPTSVEVDLMEVDEDVTPIINDTTSCTR